MKYPLNQKITPPIVQQYISGAEAFVILDSLKAALGALNYQVLILFTHFTRNKIRNNYV
jgi:hypothetical protein